MYAALSFVLLLVALCAQEFIPRLDESVSYGIILLFPVWFLCTAVTLPYPIMLGLSFFAGLLWDLRYTTDPGLGPAGLPITGVTPFGMSILLFGILGHFMHGVRPLYKKRQMGFPILMTGGGIFLFRMLDYLFLNFRRGNFQFPQPVFREMCSTALLSMAFAPLIYFILWWSARAIHGHHRFVHGD